MDHIIVSFFDEEEATLMWKVRTEDIVLSLLMKGLAYWSPGAFNTLSTF